MSPREKGEKEGDNKAWLRTALGPHVCFAFHDNGWLLRTLFVRTRHWARVTSPSMFPPWAPSRDRCTNLTPLVVAADDKVDADVSQANTRLWKCLFSISLG